MATEITVPVFPESVTEGQVLVWHKQAGEQVARGDVLAEIETDKVVFEVPAPDSGVLVEISVPVGATVTSGQAIARLDKSAKAAAAPSPITPPPAVAKTATVMPAAKRAMAEHGLEARKFPGTG
ncbi:MAG: biotin/lipoyl-containing protein [Pseudomonadota bacterium]